MSLRVVNRAASFLELHPYQSDGAAWDAFLGETEGATFCHLAGWRGIMEDVLGHRCDYRVATGPAGRIEGVLPLVEVRSRLLGHYLLSMPFLNDGGPVGSREARHALATHARELAAARCVGLLELRTRAHDYPDLARSERKVTVHLPLPSSAAELWEKGFRAKLRSQIRRPQKEGMETRIGADQVRPFYEVFARNMRDLGTPVLPLRFFEAIARTFPEQAVFAAVYHQGQPIAAGCGFLWKDEFEITWASALQEFNRLSPNMLLYWSLMEHVIDREARVFNFGRCTPGGATHRFKLQWGGHDVALPWAQWSASDLSAPPSPERPIFRVATAAWQRLPLSMANRIGPVLARRLP